MPFFQNSVINKYKQNLDKQTIHDAYAKFRSHFHNAIIQENIRGSKEEQYQGEFLIDLFVNVLGYTKNPTPNFNLTTEYKNVKDSKKADGAIIINDVVKAVIELKGTNTTDLNKIETQAFGYKNNQPECEYVITSNFEKIRFYIDNAIDYLEFNLFTLTEKEFELLYICLSYESISKGLPKQLKDESVSQEDLITKKLYKDYSVFKSELYHSLVKLNPQYNPLELFKKSQKLLDRFLFIFFAEDRQLLPTNLIFRINKEWQQLREMRIEVSLYDRYKIYFNDLDCGARVSLPAFSQTASKQKEEFEIYAYNGGLFKKDDLLNDIKIEDDLLFLHTEKLSNYDFASEVDVNVLGHIFENSLNDVDEIKAQLEGQEIDKTKTKRKKDGVFYTPKYITKYIVDNTVGKLCLEKKEALQLTESDYTIDKKRQKKTTQALTDTLNEYRNWLLQLTICDPACGSGAFLNQALDFLITEHRYIDELQAKLFGDALVLSDVEGSILENNLFGVDINEESVEIAKLSLWLRTAQPNRKLNDLNSNIKCGNSLIDDVAVAGDKAFNWEQEFPQVFQNTEHDKKYVNVETRLGAANIYATKDSLGDYKDDSYGLYNEFHEPKFKYKPEKEKKHGFDVVIGNPPYVGLENISDIEKIFYKKTYSVLERKYDTSVIFKLMALSLLKINGKLGFITTVTWQTGENYSKVREYLFKKYDLTEIINLPFNVFEGAYVDTGIVIIKNKESGKSYNIYCFEKNFPLKALENIKFQSVEESTIDKSNWRIILNTETQSLYSKFKKQKGSVNLGEISISTQGLSPSRFIILPENTDNKSLYPYLVEGQVYQYLFLEDKIGYTDMSDKQSLIQFYEATPKILFRRLINRQDRLTVSYTENKIVFKKDVNPFIITNKDFNPKYVLSVLASKFISYLYVNTSSIATKDDFRQTTLSEIRNLPILKIEEEKQSVFVQKADSMLTLNRELQIQSLKFQRSIERKFNLDSLPKKLEDWYLHSYSDFIKELAKKKIKLSLSDEAEWEEYFNTESKKALELKTKIDATDKEIDQMVYKLYDLTDEEIKIVESN
jgi:type I restriction-modification system DNA methylase subunit